MKKISRIIAAVLSLALAVTQLPPSDMARVHAAEGSTSLSGGEGIRSYTDADGNVFLGGKYIEVGISKAGSFGTSRSAPTKEDSGAPDDITGRTIWFHPCANGVDISNSLGMVSNGDENGSESGWNTLTSDYFLPYLVNEGWMLGWDQSCQASGCQIGNHAMQNTGILSSQTVNKSTAYEACAETTITTTSNMQIIQTVSFALEDKNFRTSVRIKNIGQDTRTDVRFLRGFDPDQGKSTSTYNVVGNDELDEKGVSVTAYARKFVDGKVTDEKTTPFIYFTEDERAHAGWKKAVNLNGTDLFAIDNPASSKDLYHLTQGDSGYGDYAVFLYYDFPEIAAGEEVRTSYYSSMDTNILTAAEGLLRLDISEVDRDTEIPNRISKKVNASVNAEITGVDPTECDVTYQWYQIPPHTAPASGTSVASGASVTSGTSIASGEAIEGAVLDHFSFSPSGREEDAGTYYVYCEVTATTLDGKQTVTKDSKKLKIEVYNEYDLTYDANGGTGTIAGRTDIRQGSEIQAASADSLTPPAGKIFSCWNTEADGSGDNILAGHMLTMNSDITLYAQWNDPHSIQFTVSLDDEKLTEDDDEFLLQVGRADADRPQDFKETEFQGNYWHCDELEEDIEYKIYIYRVTQLGNQLIGVSDLFTTDLIGPMEVEMYTIGWDVNGDDRVDEETVVMAGETPAHADPDDISNAQYTYEFDGWKPQIVPAAERKTYSAHFRQTVKQYHVILPVPDIANGYTILPEEGSVTTVDYGGSYSFQLGTKMGWDPTAWVVTANEIRLIPDEDGIYHIKNIGADGRDVEVKISSTAPKQLPVVANCAIKDITKDQATAQFTCRHASYYYLFLYRTEADLSLTREEAIQIISGVHVDDQAEARVAAQPLLLFDHDRMTETEEDIAYTLRGLQEDTGYTVFVIARNTVYDYSSLVRVDFKTLGTTTAGSPSPIPSGSADPDVSASPSVAPTGSTAPIVSGSPSQVPTGSAVPNVSASPSVAPTGSTAPDVSNSPSTTAPAVPTFPVVIVVPVLPVLPAPTGTLANQENIDKVIAAITAIGDVALTDDVRKRIEAARAAYESLTPMEKALLPDIYYRMLIRAEQDYLLLKTTGDIWKNATVAQLEDVVLNENTDKDIDGSIYNKIRARLIPKSDTVQQLRWHRVEEADGYIIYGNKCGLIYKMKRLKTVKKNDITSWTRKNQRPGTYYKYIVAAYRNVDGEKKIVSVSKSVHSITNGGKYKDPKGVKLNRSSRSTKVKGKVKITGHLVMTPGTRMKYHVKTLRFESSNPTIARVNAKGIVTGVKKGKTTIFVYAQNGSYHKFKITVTG